MFTTGVRGTGGRPRRYFEELRNRDKTHRMAIPLVSDRWLGILHACL